jgi:hypothetical protein
VEIALRPITELCNYYFIVLIRYMIWNEASGGNRHHKFFPELLVALRGFCFSVYFI